MNGASQHSPQLSADPVIRSNCDVFITPLSTCALAIKTLHPKTVQINPAQISLMFMIVLLLNMDARFWSHTTRTLWVTPLLKMPDWPPSSLPFEYLL